MRSFSQTFTMLHACSFFMEKNQFHQRKPRPYMVMHTGIYLNPARKFSGRIVWRGMQRPMQDAFHHFRAHALASLVVTYLALEWLGGR